MRSVNDEGRLIGYFTNENSGVGIASLSYRSGDVNAGQMPHLVHLFNDYAIDTDLDVLVDFDGVGNPRPISTIASPGTNFDDAGAIDVYCPRAKGNPIFTRSICRQARRP